VTYGPDSLNLVVNEAINMVGTPYEFGAKWPIHCCTPKGPIDCSGLTRWAYCQALGIDIGDGSQNQHDNSVPVDSPWPGDLCFFGHNKRQDDIYHVGICRSQTEVVEAHGHMKLSPDDKTFCVTVRSRQLWEAYPDFVGWQRPRLANC
jgi:cell wall-associated NlpC family hydrolase